MYAEDLISWLNRRRCSGASGEAHLKITFHIVPFSNAANEETIAAFVAYAGALAVFLSDS